LGYWAGDTGADGGADGGCSVSGTDYASTAMATVNVGDANKALGDEYVINLNTTEFTNMVNNNYGIVIEKGSQTVSTTLFCSSDHETIGYRPVLTVVYEDASPTPTPAPAPGVKFSGVKMSGVCAGNVTCPTHTP
jgi:hypothetical protein